MYFFNLRNIFVIHFYWKKKKKASKNWKLSCFFLFFIETINMWRKSNLRNKHTVFLNHFILLLIFFQKEKSIFFFLHFFLFFDFLLFFFYIKKFKGSESKKKKKTSVGQIVSSCNYLICQPTQSIVDIWHWNSGEKLRAKEKKNLLWCVLSVQRPIVPFFENSLRNCYFLLLFSFFFFFFSSVYRQLSWYLYCY